MIKILSLYADLLNLYGNYGNIKCLIRHIKEAGIEVDVTYKTVGDEISFEGFDLVYMGAGTERNRDRALCDFIKYKNAFSDYIENNGLCLICGNSFDMLGKAIHHTDNTSEPALGLYNFETYETKKRVVADTVCTAKFLNEKIIGFMNKQSFTSFVPNPMFRVVSGSGNAPDRNDEGLQDKSLYATSLAGPILVRNPHFCAHIEKELYKKKGLNTFPSGFVYEQMAYNTSLDGLTK